MITQMILWDEKSKELQGQLMQFKIEEATQKLHKIYRGQTGLFKRLEELKKESQELEGILEDLVSAFSQP